MNPKYFGDSYDIVKHFLLRWLGPLGPWSAHPMFTDRVTGKEAKAFSALLGVPLVSTLVLTQGQDRDTYFGSALACTSHLFLDPDTGVRIALTRGKKAPSYLFIDELVRIASRRADLLTLVFDQSVPRGDERESLCRKLDELASSRVRGFAYVSHACFLLVGPDAVLVRQARQILERQAHLATDRFVRGQAA